MILAILLALAAAPHSLPLMDEEVEVPAADWRAFGIPLRQQSARIECAFSVAHGSGVRVMLVERSEFDLLSEGRGYHALAATAYQPAGGVSYPARPGEYVIVVDNRMDGRGPARVRLQVNLVLGAAGGQVRTLSPARRTVVVGLSILFFATVLLWAGGRAMRAFRARPGPPQSPFGE